ncbi:hypothetical protein J4E81_010507 [Alternaria sp. BMP 2799]|nr:hypothetical protein J4E81_010507 [Alternaria sp. BMP 2799]
MGTGLTAAQKEYLTSDSDLRRALPLGSNRDNGSEIIFFGSTMHDGLRGYVLTVKSGEDIARKAADQKVVMFGTDVEIEDTGVPDIQTFTVSDQVEIVKDVKIGSEGHVLVYVEHRSAAVESVVLVKDFAAFRRYLEAGEMGEGTGVTVLPYELHDPPLFAGNATTMTALDVDGHVWTETRDPRYEKCLGRPYDGALDIAPVPYFEVTYVTKVASGGYMSAAFNSDGELFLWGQACPGSNEELDVLNGNPETSALVTGISTDDVQEEFVKCLDVRIDGQDAKVYEVAVGHGHILVAAQTCKTEGRVKRVLFAAGDNNRGQLGLATDADFKKRFEGVTALRDERIIQLAAAGWSTYVLTLEE